MEWLPPNGRASGAGVKRSITAVACTLLFGAASATETRKLIPPSLPPVSCRVPQQGAVAPALIDRRDPAQGMLRGDTYGAAPSCGSVKTKSCPLMGLWH
jgi:hypothetical protein